MNASCNILTSVIFLVLLMPIAYTIVRRLGLDTQL